MANRITMQFLLSAIVFFLFVSSAFAADDAPFIVAHKKATLNRLKSGVERVLVSIEIYNQGSATAYDVTLSDNSWPQDAFSVVSGNLSTSWEKLDVGSMLSHSFELEGKVKGLFYGAPAVITYRIPTNAALLEAYSTPILPLDVLADKPSENKLKLVKRLLASYGPQVSVVSIIAVFIILITSPSKGTSKGNKKRR